MVARCRIVSHIGKEQRCVEVLMDGLRTLSIGLRLGWPLPIPPRNGTEIASEVGLLDNLADAVRQRNGDFPRRASVWIIPGGRSTGVPARPTPIPTSRSTGAGAREIASTKSNIGTWGKRASKKFRKHRKIL